MIKNVFNQKLVVQPLMGILVHTHFWEGPCRAGIMEEMQPEVEMKRAKSLFEEYKEKIKNLPEEIEVLEPILVPYYQDFVVKTEIEEEINKNLHRIDCLIVMNQRIPKIERFKKPVISFTHTVSAADTTAYLRSIGMEGYYAIDRNDLEKILHRLWVRKALNNTRVLVLSAAEVPTWGLLSNIKDYEFLRNKYGVEIVKKPFSSIFEFMKDVDRSEAKKIMDSLYAGSQENRVKEEYRLMDIVYYLAAKKMLDYYSCNAFSTSCVELCISQVPQKEKFVPCLTHTLLKDEGIMSACEEDLNALMAMMVSSYTAYRPAFMGNPLYESDELITVHHSVPCMYMNGYGTEKLKYSIYAFTGQGFGGKLQVDFSQNKSNTITISRFSPDAKKMLIKEGKVLSTEYKDLYCSPWYMIEVGNTREYLDKMMNYGHHQCIVFGSWTKEIKEVAKIIGLEIEEA